MISIPLLTGLNKKWPLIFKIYHVHQHVSNSESFRISGFCERVFQSLYLSFSSTSLLKDGKLNFAQLSVEGGAAVKELRANESLFLSTSIYQGRVSWAQLLFSCNIPHWLSHTQACYCPQTAAMLSQSGQKHRDDSWWKMLALCLIHLPANSHRI